VSPQRRARAVRTPAQRIAFWLGWWVVCYALWVLLVFKTEPAEFVAGALAAALAATGAELVRSRGYAPFAPRFAWSRGLIWLPRDFIVDTWRMTVLLVRSLMRREPIKGHFRIVSVPDLTEDDPRAQARRIVAGWLGTISPNTYVIGIDEDHDVAVIHQLIRDDEPPELRPLG